MTTDKGIVIYNIYYMLSYAFQVLRKNTYENVDKEDFEHIQDLFAEILFRGVSAQLKQGLYREYVKHHDSLPTLKGKLNVNGTIYHRLARRQLLDCEFEELSENNIFNQTLKTTILLLCQSNEVQSQRRRQLRDILPFFNDVDAVEPLAIHWNMLRFQRNNKSYRMLINICYFILKGMLLSTKEGAYRITSFSDEHMSRLYEKFVLSYYCVHHPELNPGSYYIDWNLDEGQTLDKSFLPIMHSDIMLTRGENVLIIDTKYYQHMTAENFGNNILHSNNVYQIHTYVVTKQMETKGKVTGMLLYAKVDGEKEPTTDVTQKNGIRIMARTLDLSKPFDELRKQLETISNII